MLRTLTTLLFLLIASTTFAEEPLKATITPKDGEIKITTDNETTIVSLQSDRGIGKATLKREGQTWPRQIVLRIHLKGLESFKLSTPSTHLSWSVSSHGNATTTAYLQVDNKETKLTADHPLFAEIKTIPAADAIPLNDKAYFELKLPTALLKPDESEFQLQWIDFYRN